MSSDNFDSATPEGADTDAAFATERQKLETRLRDHSPAIAKCVVTYDGSGDEGQITETRATSNNGEPVTISDDLSAAVEGVVDLFVEIHHSDYDFGEGGGGTVTIDVVAGSWTLEAYNNVIERETWAITV